MKVNIFCAYSMLRSRLQLLCKNGLLWIFLAWLMTTDFSCPNFSADWLILWVRFVEKYLFCSSFQHQRMRSLIKLEQQQQNQSCFHCCVPSFSHYIILLVIWNSIMKQNPSFLTLINSFLFLFWGPWIWIQGLILLRQAF